MAVGSVTPVSGMNTAETSSTPLFGLKTNVLGDDGNQWVYGQASAAISAGVCTYTNATGAITAAAGSHTAPVAIASGDYAWVRLTTGIHG